MIATLALLLGTAILLFAIRRLRRRRLEAFGSFLSLVILLGFTAAIVREPDRFRLFVDSLRRRN